MIGKHILHLELMGKKGYDHITKDVCKWMRAGQDFEDWVGHRFQQRVSRPHCRLDLRPNMPATRSSGNEDYVSYKILSYNNADCLIVWVPLWWVELWHKGRNTAVRYANTHQFERDVQEINWYHAFSRSIPTLGQWIYLSICQNTWIESSCGNTMNFLQRREFPTCDRFYQQGQGTEGWKDKWLEFAGGFLYRGRRPVSFVAHRGNAQEQHLDYQGRGFHSFEHLGNIPNFGMSQSMTFCENTFFYRRH